MVVLGDLVRASRSLFGALGLTDPAGGGGGVAYFAHIGGFAFGLLAIRRSRTAATTPTRRRPPGSRPDRRRASPVLASLAARRRARRRRLRDRRATTRRPPRAPARPHAPLQVVQRPGRARRRGTSPLTLALTGDAGPGPDQVRQAAARRAAVRPRHRQGPVAQGPDARPADRLGDQDDDRAGRHRPRPAGRQGPGHQGGAGLPGLRRRRAAQGQVGRAVARCCTGCCCRRATTRRSRWPSAPPDDRPEVRRA